MAAIEWSRMTEPDWLSASDPSPMLLFLPHIGLERKFRLFACACARRVWHLCENELPRQLLELGEQLADAPVSREELWPIVKRARKFRDEQYKQGLSIEFHAAAALSAAGSISGKTSHRPYEGYGAASTACHAAASALGIAAKAGIEGDERFERQAQAEAAEQAIQAELLRDVFGNVFRPEPAMDPTCLPAPVVALAQEIYDKKSFEKIPALATMLEASGCANTGLLQHFRHPGPHVRGCWALDLVLGKSEVLDIVALLAKSEDAGERMRALEAVGAWDGRRDSDIQALVTMARHDPHPALRKEAREALKKIAPEALKG
jgi:hypothetical protein